MASPSAPIQAATRDGYFLPVINVSDPRFAVPDDPDSLRKLFDIAREEERRNRRIPKFIMRWLAEVGGQAFALASAAVRRQRGVSRRHGHLCHEARCRQFGAAL